MKIYKIVQVHGDKDERKLVKRSWLDLGDRGVDG